MAEASISVAQEQFICSVCLDLLRDPVTIPCGHSYCMDCITECWNQEDPKGVYNCPQCRQGFKPRPALNKSTILAQMVEILKKTKIQTPVSVHCYAGPGDVGCDICSGNKYKAIKSCLVCLTSYCQNHLEHHETIFKGKSHNLMNATGRLQEMVCRKHDKQLDIYCRTDQQCICYLCAVDDHKTHDTLTAAADRTEKQKQLGSLQKEIKMTIQQRDKDVQELKKTLESFKRSAQVTVENSERIFTDLIRSIERNRSEVTQLIRDQEKAAMSQAKVLLKQLETEIVDLRRRNAELEQLSHSDDHIHFIQSFQDLAVIPESTDVSSITAGYLLSFDILGKSISLLRGKLEDFYKEEIAKITRKVKCIQIIPAPEPQTRDEFLQYFHQLTLDPDTAHKQLCLSEGNRAVQCTEKDQKYPDHPDRFDNWVQVLCRESVYGRCYWEFEWTGHFGVGISVSYKTMSRKGDLKSRFGYNEQSWRLRCSSYSYVFSHSNKHIKLPNPPSSCRMGVYVDHSAGILSFYNVSGTMTLIHRVETTFTQPLYPGFLVCSGSTVKLCVL
nr:finTRIM family, member 64 [Misgurnus anguillicaudatus]